MKDILERLLSRATHTFIVQGNPNLYYDAAHEIERLRAENETLRRDVRTAVMGDSAELQDVKRENEKLRAALKPFADRYAYTQKYCPDKGHMPIDIDDLRAAAAALKESGE